jgi:hypothetical protein
LPRPIEAASSTNHRRIKNLTPKQKRKDMKSEQLTHATATGVFLLLFGVASAAPSLSNKIVEWTPAEGGNGHYYEAIHIPEGISWSSANNIARCSGGYLATITSSNENAFVFALVKDPKFWDKAPGTAIHGPWLGGIKSGENFEWVTGEKFEYTNWAGSNPNGFWYSVEENRIHYLHGTTVEPTWNDNRDDPALWDDIIDFHTVVKGFIIEYNPASAD